MQAQDIKTVAVVGGGTMGQGITQNFAQAGLSVWVIDVDKSKLDECLAQVEANLRLFEEFGLLKEDVAVVKQRIRPALIRDLAELSEECDFIVETVPEALELKRELFAQLDSCREEVILSSNSSSFTISTIAEGFRTRGRMIGLHYFNPAHIMPLVEIHGSPDTGKDVINITRELMLRVGKKPIVLRKEIPGFLVNRIQGAMSREIMYLLNESIASAEDIDFAAKATYGFRYACIGNIEAYDMVGWDTIMASCKQTYKTLSNSIEPSPIVVEKVRKGELGVKSGKGFFDYTGKTKAEILDSQNRRLLRQLALFQTLVEG